MNIWVLFTAFILFQGCLAYSPVILVPGDGGSQLQAKLNRTETVHYFCHKMSSDYFDIWLNLELLVPYVIDCWIDNMKLRYDNVTRKTLNAPGVSFRTADFGGTSTVDWLDPSQAAPSRYFIDLSDALVGAGLKRNSSIRGTPYDFRRSPNELPELMVNLKNLIEDTYKINANKKVVVVAHSMGCPTMLYFLKNQSQSWKNKYIKAFVTLSGVYGGAAKAMRVFASGDNLSVYVLRPLTLRQEQRTFSSLSFLLPSDKFWNSSEVLVQTATKNYTVSDYKEFFHDLPFVDGYNMWEDSRNLIYDLQPPGVDVHCLHGVSVPTEEKFIYAANKFPDSQPKIVYGDGDGTVNVKSLEGCLRWKNSSKQKVFHKTFPKIDHMNILRHQPALDYIKNLISS